MLTMTQKARTAQAGEYQWWRDMDQAGSMAEDALDVLAAPLFDVDWCAIRHVSLGSTPHRVQFCRDSHTLLIFDRGSFVEGERWVDGARLTTSGPLDIGLDVVPAHSEFHAFAARGSNVGCTVISIVGDGFADTTGASLRPSVGLENDFLSLLTARVRQLSRADEVAVPDRLYLESICMVLFREVLLAQEQAQVASPLRPTGGLSARAQRIIRDFVHDHDNLDQKVGLQALADLAGVSRFHFTRAFKVSFGVSPYKYLLNLRLRKAADLLRETQLPITDIALSVGFSCSSEFARAFKETMEYTPREFRQTHRSFPPRFPTRPGAIPGRPMLGT